MNWKKLDRYLRVYLLEPGPPLMKREFTGPRPHKGWEHCHKPQQISLVPSINTYYKFRSYWPSTGIKNVIFKTQKLNVYTYIYIYIYIYIYSFVEHASLYNLVNEANLVECRYAVMQGGMKFHSTLRTRQSSTHSDKYQVSHRYS